MNVKNLVLSQMYFISEFCSTPFSYRLVYFLIFWLEDSGERFWSILKVVHRLSRIHQMIVYHYKNVFICRA